MSRPALSLKTRVRYEGLAQMFDRRPNHGVDLDRLPDPMWYTVGHILRKKFNRVIRKRQPVRRRILGQP
jgi:hypothetical protein